MCAGQNRRLYQVLKKGTIQSNAIQQGGAAEWCNTRDYSNALKRPHEVREHIVDPGPVRARDWRLGKVLCTQLSVRKRTTCPTFPETKNYGTSVFKELRSVSGQYQELVSR